MASLSIAPLGCVSTRPPVREVDAGPFYTLESGFTISVREQAVRYALTLETMAESEETQHLTVYYENPLTPDEPLIEQLEWPPGEPFLFLISPPIQGLEAGKTYQVKVKVFADQTREKLTDTYEVDIYSNVDTRRHGR